MHLDVDCRRKTRKHWCGKECKCIYFLQVQNPKGHAEDRRQARTRTGASRLRQTERGHQGALSGGQNPFIVIFCVPTTDKKPHDIMI